MRALLLSVALLTARREITLPWKNADAGLLKKNVKKEMNTHVAFARPGEA